MMGGDSVPNLPAMIAMALMDIGALQPDQTVIHFHIEAGPVVPFEEAHIPAGTVVACGMVNGEPQHCRTGRPVTIKQHQVIDVGECGCGRLALLYAPENTALTNSKNQVRYVKVHYDDLEF